METKDLVRYILPKEIIDSFDVVNIMEIASGLDIELHIYLDEKKEFPPEHKDKQLESKGFVNAVKIGDFPIRDKKVLLHVRRRKWQDKETQKVYTRQHDLKHEGTNYTKEFAAFLKEHFG